MASLKTLRLKKLENLNAIKEIVEGRTYYVESNNTLYRDVLSTRMAVGQVYFAPKGIANLGEEKTLTLSNVLVILNENVDSDTPAYRMGMYDENGEYIDLSAGILIKNVELDDENNLVLIFEDGTTTSVPLSDLLTGVVKSVNDKTPDSSGAVSLGFNDVTGLQDELDGKAPLSHGHEIDDVIDLQSALNDKANKIHKHESSDITDAVNIGAVPLATLNGNLQINRITNLQTELDKTIEDIKVNGSSLPKTDKSVSITIPSPPTLENIAGTLPVSKGGTGRTTLTQDRVLVGNGTNQVKLVEQINLSQIDIQQSQITGLGDALSGLESDITANTDDITALETRVETNEGNIGNLQSGLGITQTNISSLTNRVGTAEGKITTLEGRVTNNTTSITNLTPRVEANEDNIDEIQEELSNQINIDEVPIIKGMYEDNYFKGVQLNNENFKITFTRRDDTTAVIDLPLESVVVGGSYDTENKKIILTLQNGNTIKINVADLVTGLVSIPDLAKGEASNKTLGTTGTFKVLHISTSGTITERTMTLNITANDVLGVTLAADKVLVGAGSNQVKLVDQTPISAWAMKSTLDPTDVPSIPISRVTNLETQLNSKQDSIGYTPENITNKKTSWSTTVSNTNYPSEKLVKDSLDSKVDKVSGKGLSTNDYTNTDKQRVGKIPIIEQNILELESDKVDKVTGKQLSTEDYTTTEKNKLSGIQTGAQVNKIESISLGSGVLPISNNKGVVIPTTPIYAWAMAENKPSYNLDEISDGTTYKRVSQSEKDTWDAKQSSITGAATTITSSNLTTNRALISNGSGKVAVSPVTSTELGYLDGVTSNIQTQLNGKLNTGANLPEANLVWGGKNFSSSYGPIDAAMVSELGANRLAFMPPAALDIEYSRDGGSTWIDYGATDQQKTDLFNGVGTTLRIGKNTATGTNTANYQLRIVINTSQARVYTALNKFVMSVSTDGSSGSWVTVDARLQSNVTANIDTWTVFSNKTTIGGWSGYNVINTSNITTYGNTPSSQYGQVRFTFGCTGQNVSYLGLRVMKILGFGGVGWTTPSTLAKSGEMYTYNWEQNVQFPKEVYSNGSYSATNMLTNRGWVTSNTRSNTWTPSWSQVSGKPSWIGDSKPTYTAGEVGAAPSTHTHAYGNITGLTANTVLGRTTNNGPAELISTIQIPSWAMEDNKPSYDLDEISDGTTYKKVTESEKDTWSGKQSIITGAATTITSSNLTTNRALISNGSGKVAVSPVTSTELGYLDGVTSSIQTQLSNKANDNEVVRATTENKNILGTNQEVFNISEKKVWFNKGALFYGTAAAAGLVTRGISGVTTNGSAKDHLYINYDGNNTLSRQLVLGAGSTGTNRGNGIYDYSAVRGDAFIAYLTNTLGSYEKTANKKTSIRDSGADNTSYVSELGVKNYVDTKLSAKQDKLTLNSGQVLGRNSSGTGDVEAVNTININQIKVSDLDDGTSYAKTADLTSGLAGKAPLSHKHAIADVTGLQGALDGKSATGHTHGIADVTGLATQRLLGRYSAGTGNVQPITIGSNLTLSTGGVLSATNTVYTHPNSGVTAGTYRSVTVNSQGHVTAGTNPTTLAGYGIALSGDVTNSNNVITIGPKKVTLSKIQDIATGKVLGRTTSGTGVVEELSLINIDEINQSNWTQVWSGGVNLNSYRSGWYTATVPSNTYIGKRIAIEVQYGSGTTYTSKIIFGVLGSSSATGADPSVSKGVGWNYFDGTYLRVKTLFIYTSTSNTSAIYVGNLKTLFGKFTGTTIEWSTSYSETLCMKKIWVIE